MGLRFGDTLRNKEKQNGTSISISVLFSIDIKEVANSHVGLILKRRRRRPKINVLLLLLLLLLLRRRLFLLLYVSSSQLHDSLPSRIL